MNTLDKTTSICPECNKVLDAEIFERDKKVWIKKECPEHGDFEEIYWGDADYYTWAKKFASDGKGLENPDIGKDNPICPQDCGLCSLHKSHTALANMVLTNRCDLSCWYCFFYADKAGYVYEPTLEQIRTMLKNLRDEQPVPCNAIQLTGGEPTLRDDLVEIVKICKEAGFDHIQVNTNGIKLSKDPQLVIDLRTAGVNTLYLSFDGVTPKTNPKNHWEIPDVIENCRNAGLGIVLVPTIIRGVNDHEVGAIIDFAVKNITAIRGVNFQPVSLVGKMPRSEREKHRITIPDVLDKIEEQTNGQITKMDFYPVPSITAFSSFIEAFTRRARYELSTHFACGAATFVFKYNNKLIPISHFVDIEGLFKFLQEQANEMKNGKARLIVTAKLMAKIGSFIDNEKKPESLKLAKILFDVFIKHNYKSLAEFTNKSLFIGMMHFQDKYNYDIERVKRCCIHYATPDPEMPIVPFCAFNVIPEWYRDKIQKKYGTPIAEWEKQTGRTLKDDLYKRKLP